MGFTRLILCSLLLLSACALKPTTPAKPTSSANTSAPANTNTSITDSLSKIITGKHERVDELLAFIESYSNLAPDAQKKAFSTTNQALAENKGNLMLRAKVAIMLAIPTSRVRDPAKAQTMLQDLLREDSLESQENALFGLLYEYALDDNKQMQKSRDDAKKLEAAQQKYEALQMKNEALEQKLNDLKNIEKKINDRSKP